MDSLPEDIRSHILSLMPTKFAVQTSVLSKAWRYTWTLLTNLDFDFGFVDHFGFGWRSEPFDLYSDFHSFINFVNWVFKSYKTSKHNLFRFRLHFGVGKSHVLSNWIDEAVKLNVRELDIRVHPHRLPSTIFTCTTLTMLSLHYVDDTVWECPSRVYLPSLKTLDIIVYSNPFANAFKLISGCPVLESLSLQVDNCKAEQHYIFSIPTLKRFKLKISSVLRICSQGVSLVYSKVVLRLPILEYLCVADCVSSLFVIEDLPPFLEASISSDLSTWYLSLQLLKGISGVKSLSILRTYFLVHLPIFPNMTHLELKLYSSHEVIFQFLECCPKLKHLCLGRKSSLYLYMEPKVVPGCIRTTLTTLKYALCKETKGYDMKVLKYILGNAEVLKTVTIYRGQFLSLEEEMSLYTEVLKFPRASMDCAIKSGSSSFALLK